MVPWVLKSKGRRKEINVLHVPISESEQETDGTSKKKKKNRVKGKKND